MRLLDVLQADIVSTLKWLTALKRITKGKLICQREMASNHRKRKDHFKTFDLHYNSDSL